MHEAEIILLTAIFLMNVVSILRENTLEKRMDKLEKIINMLLIQKENLK